MKYSSEVIINLHRDEVVKKLDNMENIKHWQRGLINAEQIEGLPGKEGAKMKLEYQMGKRHVVLTETITKNGFPEEFHAQYDTKGVHNIQKNYFHKMPDGSTKWVSESEFQFQGFGMKLMGFLMPGAFKKQSLKYLSDFKTSQKMAPPLPKKIMTERVKLIWDFRGPNAGPIAVHHAKHLGEFAVSEELKNCLHGNEEISEMHHTAFLIVEKKLMNELRETLKPNRGQLYTET